MNTYAFRVVIDHHTVATEEMANVVFEAGLDDASVGSSQGTVSVQVDRESDSLEAAIASACKQLQDAGYEVASVEILQPSLGPLLA